MTGETVLRAEGIRKQFFGAEVLHGISLEVHAGTVVSPERLPCDSD